MLVRSSITDAFLFPLCDNRYVVRRREQANRQLCLIHPVGLHDTAPLGGEEPSPTAGMVDPSRSPPLNQPHLDQPGHDARVSLEAESGRRPSDRAQGRELLAT